MTEATHRELAGFILKHHGRTYAEEAGIQVGSNTPSALFQLLYMALLLSARIAAGNAMEAAKALKAAGLTTPKNMAAASWQDRVDVITWHGYKRYDEKTSTMLGQAAELCLARYHGDLRQLRGQAEYEVTTEKELLKEFKGIGEVGADIFLREVQNAWGEAYPYADRKVLDSAAKLGLPGSPDQLAALVPRERFAHFTAGLIRIALEKGHERVKAAAAVGR